MAIAFVAAGTRSKVDVSVTGSPVAVALPAGHASGHWLIMYVVTEDNTGPSTPSGWSLLGGFSPGVSAPAPYAGRPHVNIFARFDNGSLGSSVNVTFSTNPWPLGDPYVLAWTEAYSGVDTSGPVESIQGNSVQSTAAAHSHPTATTVADQTWLLSLRAVGADTAKTFTVAGGTNTERVDDTTGFPASPSAASYTAGPLTAGAQTQRVTTASGTVEYGSVAVSIVIKPSGGANPTPSPSVATVTATAYNSSVVTVNGSWSVCSTDSLPEYLMSIDWDDSGDLEQTGRVISTNPYFRWGISNYSANNATLTWDDETFRQQYGINALKITPNGSSASGGANQSPHSVVASVTPGQSYTAVLWAYSPGGWSDLQPAVDWFNAADGFISSGIGTGAAVPAGVWTRIERTYVAPALASRASIRARHGGTPAASNIWYVWGLLLADPAYPSTFMAPGAGEDTGADIISSVSISYGRDQDRQLSPSAVGNASYSVINTSRRYSPENTESALYGTLNPARDVKMAVAWNGVQYPLFRGRLDDYNVKTDFADRTVDFTFLDGMAVLQGVKLSTGVYESMRTGQLVDTILDLAGWTGPRDLDDGATVVKFWWAEGTDALSAIQELVESEGPPAIAYQAPDGTFVFRDRHHRLLRTQSLASQATYAASEIACDSPAATGYHYTPPFIYAHGWRDIVNVVSFDVQERVADGVRTAVWTSDSSYSLAIGQSVEVTVSTSDPFKDAITPVQGTDFTKTGAGTVNVVLDRTSGASAKITLLAVGGAVNLSNLRLRARAIPVLRTTKILKKDTASIGQHGERAYPDGAPWANANDAEAIANVVLLHYAQRRPTVQLRIVTEDPAHFMQVLQRTVSDRIHITNGEMLLDDDFFVERVTHTIQRFNKLGVPPVHSVVLGCERQLTTVANPFTFDKRGAGFDDGVFDPIQSDNAATVFIFDHPIQGQFDLGLFGT